MASCSLWIFFAFYFCISFALCSVFDTILDDVEPCKEACDKTYPLHTYPNPKHAECCKRGCRFFSLVEFLHQGQDVNSTKDSCMASCMEAYSQTGDRYACNIGCSNQVPYTVRWKQAELTEAETKKNGGEEPQTMHVLTPFMYVHKVYNNMVDKMSRLMSVSWSVYFQQDNGKLVVVQSEPEIVAEYLDMEDVEDKNKEDCDDDDMIAADGAGSLLRDESTLGAHSSKSLPDIYYYHRQASFAAGSVEPASGDMPIRITVSAYASEEVQSVDWLGCVSRKSGLPRWLLGLIIFFSAIVMVWLCFATSVTSSEYRTKPQVISIQGDLGYLRSAGCVVQEKQDPRLILCSFENKSNSEPQAAPLPSKEELQRLV